MICTGVVMVYYNTFNLSLRNNNTRGQGDLTVVRVWKLLVIRFKGKKICRWRLNANLYRKSETCSKIFAT